VLFVTLRVRREAYSLASGTVALSIRGREHSKSVPSQTLVVWRTFATRLVPWQRKLPWRKSERHSTTRELRRIGRIGPNFLPRHPTRTVSLCRTCKRLQLSTWQMLGRRLAGFD
jgi:hypothetical protein